jgi:predicted HTH transcriptional regulator
LQTETESEYLRTFAVLRLGKIWSNQLKTTNKMTTNSKMTFLQTVELRLSNKSKCLEALRTEPNQSRFEIGRKTGLGDIEAQRRLSDLYNDEKIDITGSRKHGEHEVSLYSVRSQLVLFPNVKPPTFTKWAKENHPEIWHEYEVLILHKL